METNGNGANALQIKLNDPQTTQTLSRLLDRIDSLEESVGRLADLIEQAPAFTAMVGDVMDETHRRAAANGVDLEQRLQTALTLAEKLTAPSMVSKIEQLMLAVDQAPYFAAMVGDMVDETQRQAASNGIDLEQRLGTGLALAEKLTRPQMVEQLNGLLDMADTAPGFVAMLGDMADEAYRNALSKGVDLEALMGQGLTAAGKLSALLESGILDDGAVRMVGATGKALAQASHQPIEPAGLFGLLGALRDPDTKRALGFLLNVGSNLGKELK